MQGVSSPSLGIQGRTTLGDDMDCDWVKQHLERILDGECSPEIKGELAEHLHLCPDCTEALHAAEEEERVLQTALSQVGVPRDLAPEIMASLPMAKRQSRGAKRTALFLRVALPATGVAALLMLAFGLSLWPEEDPRDGQTHRAGVQDNAPAAATLRGFSGTVSSHSEGGRARPTEPGMSLWVGAVLTTAADSAAEIGFGRKARVRLDSESRARVTSSSSILLVSGRLFVWVEEKGTRFSVMTPQAEAAVCGTEFCVDSRAEGRTVLTVVEGVVAFGNGYGSVDVEAGLQSQAEGDAGPTAARPVDVLPVVAWAGIGEQDLGPRIDVGLRVRLGQDDASPTFVVELDYPDCAYVPLWVNCETTDSEGRIVSERSLQASSRSHRYRVRKMTFADLGPGRYRAGFRIVGRAEANHRTVAFEVQ